MVKEQVMTIKEEMPTADAIASLDGRLAEFKPFAYYDKHLDCIRVQLRDCSVREERKNKIFTVLRSNHDNAGAFVGCNIKGVRHVFDKIGMEMKGVVTLTILLDAIAKYFPEASVATTVANISRGLETSELEVSFASV
jgi:hypothetical protein